MRSWRWVRAVVVVGLGVLGGCRDGKSTSGERAPAGVATARSAALTAISHTGWTASASQTLSGYPASKAIDSDGASRWTNGDYQTNQWFKVDFGAVKAFTEVEIWANATDYPRQFNVQVSNNNSTWTTVASATGTSALVQVPFAQQQARYVRIQLATSGQQYWLSIYDFNVYSTQHGTTAWGATSSGVTGSDTEAKAIDASLTTKWTSSTNQSPNSQWFQVDMRRRQTLSMVSLDGGSTSNTTYPRGYKIDASDDASTWTTLATGTGAAGVIFASFPTTQARYLKVTQTGTASVKWSLYDFLVYGQPEVPSVLSQVGWTATASKRSQEAGRSVDGVLTTGWSTETYQAVGDWYQVDMGTSRTVSGVTMDSELSNDYARSFNVYVSDDPLNFGAPAGSGTGTSPFVTATFAPKTGRYVKVQLTSVPGTSDWWGFCELNIQTPGFARAGWIVSASSTGGADEIRNAFDNNSLSRWNSAESQATEHAVTVDMVAQQTFNRITLDASPAPASAGNYPRAYEVYVSNDGTTWGAAVATGSGTGQSVSINFAIQTARYIKVRQPAVAGVTNTWSIHELEVFREPQGTCEGVTCTAFDQCHDVGTCDPVTGLCSNPPKANGTTCNDGNACTQTDTCQSGTCSGANAVTCSASDQCHTAGTCNQGTGVCSNPAKADGTTCSDGNACTQTDTCQAGACTGGNAVTCTASDQCHAAGTCDTTTGTCSNPARPDGTTCSDENACTQTDMCVAGACTGGNVVTCAASDQCHVAGTCNSGTGVCSNPAKVDGTTCSDGNACTQTDTCQAGACSGGTAVTCTASDQCHVAGTCNPGTGVCSNPAKVDGTTCSDGNACTQTDTCQAGACSGGTAVTCTASDQCHVAGTCNPGTGVCSNPAKVDGTTCSDGNACTQTDTCQAGACSGGTAVTCTASDQCHVAGTCNSGTGVCSNPADADGTSCNDGNPATVSDACSAGVCAGTTVPSDCPPPAACRLPGTRNAATGECAYPFKLDGSSCDDGNASTFYDRCAAGTCLGTVRFCDWEYGPCDDGNPCTQDDHCDDGGGCSGVPVDCGGNGSQCGGYCDPTTGACAASPVPEGSQCDDGNPCTSIAACSAGACLGTGTCDGQVEVTKPFTFSTSRPSLPMVLTVDRTSVRPREPINLSVVLTNEGVRVSAYDQVDFFNLSAGDYVLPGYSASVEYLSVATGTWVQLTRLAYDSSGAIVEAPPASYGMKLDATHSSSNQTVTFPATGLAGMRLRSGGQTLVSFQNVFVLPAEAVAVLSDPTRASAVRQVLKIEGSSGLPAGFETVNLISVAMGKDFVATNINAKYWFDSIQRPLTPATVASLPVGASATFTATTDVPLRTAAEAAALSIDYGSYLTSLAKDTRSLVANMTANVSGFSGQFSAGTPGQDVRVVLPVVVPQITAGPGTTPAGYTLSYDLTLTNKGNEVATDITFEAGLADYHIDGNGRLITVVDTVPAATSAPDTLAVSASQPGAISYPSPATSATNLNMVGQVTWTDAVGNVYGPVWSNAWSSQLTAPRPLGSLNLAGGTTAPVPVDGIQQFTVVALDPMGRPVANVPIQLAISGVNASTMSAVSDASGVAHFSHTGRYPGGDTLVASATLTTAPTQSNSVAVFWSTPYGTCTSPDTPLDVVIAIDTSDSMVGPTLEGAKAAARAFLDTMDLTRDQLGIVSFGGVARLDSGLTSDYAQARAGIDHVSPGGGFINPTSIGAGLWASLNELASARRRPSATPIIVFVSDGENSFEDPEPQLARLALSGIRTFAFALGTSVDFSMLKRIASTKNDLFYVPTANELSWLYGVLRGDLCRNQLPLVRAGGDQGAYGLRLPDSLVLHGEVHDDGPSSLTTGEWTVVSGPGTVAFLDSSSPETTALFSEPGTYVLRLTGSDGVHTATDDVTITVDPEPNVAGGTLQVALGLAGPLTTGTSETFTATLTDAASHPIAKYPVQVTVTGANPQTVVLMTNASGVVTFSYVGAAAGTDALTATALAPTPLVSSAATVEWVLPASAQPVLTQGWMGAPVHQAKVEGLVPITVAAGQTLTTGTITYWPISAPEQVRTLAMGVTGGPGATLATLDTTLLANGTWVVKLEATNSSSQSRISMLSVTVRGDYKPGRVVVEQTDLTIPLAGLPITVGRRYDSLEKDNVGDFGHGWALTLGHPRLEVDSAQNVTITMPDNRRVTFYFAPTFPSAGPIIFGFLLLPAYEAEPGVYGSLTADGCPILAFNPFAAVPSPTCFGAIEPGDLAYAPTTYTYTDPYGRVFVMSASGDLKSIADRQGNKLTFTPTGITSSTGVGVTFERDGQGRLTKITSPAVAGSSYQIVTYTYDTAGDLTKVTLPNNLSNFQFTYENHRLLTTRDPRGNPVRTSTYDTAGRLVTDTDALSKVTSYAYDLTAHKTTITNPDLGTVEQTFDARGLLLKEVDPLNRATEHTYDANRNELTRKNALNEVTTFTYDARGNQTSITNANGDATHVTYNQFSQPVTSTDANDHTTTITYDERGIPTKFADELGTLATFTSSEKGLPLTVTDAAGKTGYMVYDAAGNLTGRSDRLGRMTRNLYDGVGRLTQVTDPRGGVTQYAYNIMGPRMHVTMPTGVVGMNTRSTTYDLALNVIDEGGHGGRVVRHEYDTMNRVKKVTNVDVNQTIREYTRDFRGNPLTEKDEANRTTTYEYDKAGQLLKTTYPDGKFTTRAYDALGRLVTATDERGNATTYEYEAGCGCAERVTKVTDPLNRATVTTYDPMGRRTSVTDAANHTTTYAYDARGHLTTTTYADNTTETDAYDSRGRRISHTDQMGSVTEYGYDDEGQLTSVTDALDHVTQYAYDDAGNLKTVTDANNHATSYEYDFLSRKTKRTLPLGMSETFTYNLFNDQLTHKDFRGKTTTMTYDTRSRLLTKVPDPTLSEPTITFTYNPSGTRLRMVDASGTTNYTYDQRDRLLTKATPAGTLTYTYDPAGNVATIRSSNANGTSVDYAWDAANQLVSVTDNRAGGVTTSAYTATGRPSTLNQPSGVGATYSYNSLDRVTSLAWKQGTDPAFASWSYGLNNRGQRTSATDSTGRHVAYGYDAVSRLESETVTGDGGGVNGAVTYVLDPTGNRSSRTSSLAPIPTTTYSYDINDQLAGDGYDLNGNTTSADGQTYTYDFENRLKSKNGTAVTLVHDGDGNRVAKTAGGVTTKYLVDDLNPTGYLQVLEETSGGSVQVAYTYGTAVVSQRRPNGTSYYGYDAHGNVSFLVDENGATTDVYDYDSWGNLVASAGSTSNTRLFLGEEADPDLGLVYLRARQYRTSSGRFLTTDPAAGDPLKPPSLNRYLYANGDSQNLIDPTGRMTAVSSGILVAGVGALLLVTSHMIIQARDGVQASPDALGLGSLSGEVQCAFWRAWSGFSGIEVANALPASAISMNVTVTIRPPNPAFANCAKTLTRSVNCTPQRRQELEDAKKKVCEGNRCESTDSCEEMKAKLNRAQICLGIRLAIMQECFPNGSGVPPGDSGHQTAADQVERTIEKCTEKISNLVRQGKC